MLLCLKVLNISTFKLIYIILFAVFFSPQQLYAQKALGNEIFDVNIKTVLLHKAGFEMSEPIIQLNSNEKLLLSFDDLNDIKVKNFKYTIQHCNARWEASDLLTNQYILGFQEDYINNYEFSLNTMVPYIHYRLEFPNEYLAPILSGNYILKVYEDNEENLVFTKRFKVLEPQINIEAKVRPTADYSQRNSQQEIGFSIFTNNFYIPNPGRDLSVIVKQNGREDNKITDLKPVRILGQELDYYFNQQSIFEGGNEFRSFDIKSFRYRSEYVKAIEFWDNVYHVFLREEQSKANDIYHFEHDINGKFIIRNSDGDNDRIESDYCWVHFNLKHPFEYQNSEIFVIGEFTNWDFSETNKLTYNSENFTYEGKILLKQGYYNYQYALKNLNDPDNIDIITFEGSHYETTNDYTIYVYYMEPGTYYQQLIGYYKFTAQN